MNKILSEAINELDPRTYASYAQKRAAQGQDDKAWAGRKAAVDAFNKNYGHDDETPNGFVQKAGPNSEWRGTDRDYYRMTQNDGKYKTERWQSKNYPGQNDMDDQETFTTYDPQTDQTNSTTYGRMKYNTVGSPGKMTVNYPQYGDYNGRPIRSKNNWASGLEGDKVARQMATGTGKYENGKWQ